MVIDHHSWAGDERFRLTIGYRCALPRAGRSLLRRAMLQASTVPVFSTRGVYLNVDPRRLPAGSAVYHSWCC